MIHLDTLSLFCHGLCLVTLPVLMLFESDPLGKSIQDTKALTSSLFCTAGAGFMHWQWARVISRAGQVQKGEGKVPVTV